MQCFQAGCLYIICQKNKKTKWNAVRKRKLAETKLFNMAVSGDWSQVQVAINGTAVFLALPALTSERGCSLQSSRISQAWLYLLLGSDRVMVRVDIHVSPLFFFLFFFVAHPSTANYTCAWGSGLQRSMITWLLGLLIHFPTPSCI